MDVSVIADHIRPRPTCRKSAGTAGRRARVHDIFVWGLSGIFDVAYSIYRPSCQTRRTVDGYHSCFAAASALVGAAAGLRLKVFALVPIALLIALVSAAVLHMNGFGPGSGIVIIIACLGLNQAAYILVQLV